MRICQVNPGCGIPIPPPKWGAIERIVWEYTQNLRKLGHTVDIKYASEIKPGDYDIVHCHVGNLCDTLKANGVNYIFHLHDHHAYYYGKDSECYKTNKRAIDNSMMTLVPGRFLIKYFNSPKVQYLSHGVNTDIFKKSNKSNYGARIRDLLCVANNGMAGDSSYDRKGFGYAIKAAMRLDLSITIAGPKNNSEFFAENQWALEYPNLIIVTEPDEEELVDLYSTHKMFVNPSILEAGHPNLTLLEAMACGMPVLATIENETNLPGIYRIERDVDQIVKAIEYVDVNYDYYHLAAFNTATDFSFKNITNKLVGIYNEILKPKNMRESLVKIYEETQIDSTNIIKTHENEIKIDFVGGANVEIIGSKPANYVVEFINQETNSIEYKTEISTNHWCRPNKKYFVNWLINIYENNQLIHSHKYDASDKRVYIAFESKAMGDTLAWFPSVDEFRKNHNCKIIVSTFHNDWFEAEYPDIEFVKPGQVVHDLYAMYRIGWFYNGDKINYDLNRADFRAHHLQQTATSILGLPALEIRPKITVPKKKTEIEGKYVVIAPHASAHAKYWNNPGGWQTVINWLNTIGYKVVMLTMEKLGVDSEDAKLGGTLTGVIDKTGDISIQDRMVDIRDADLFIGLGSGLSWLSWALGTKTMLISGFSNPYTEFSDCIRIFTNKPYTCNGCFNKQKLNTGDWDWCPEHKGTHRQFECTRTIQPDEIINAINDILL